MNKFSKMRRKTWNSVNNITSYHASMVHALGTTSKHYVTHQVHWNSPKGYIKINKEVSYIKVI